MTVEPKDKDKVGQPTAPGGGRIDARVRRTLDEVLEKKEPPVARCRLLSSGMKPYHRLNLTEAELAGDQGCLGCGCCVDSCPVLRREPSRYDDTAQRTSFSLEHTVGEDCEQCYSCVLACPQVDTALKDYVVDSRIPETTPPSAGWTLADYYLTPFFALAVGFIAGVFLMR